MNNIDEVPAGNVLGIGGLDDIVFRTATLSNLKVCPSLTPIYIGAKGLIKVALSAENLDEAPLLI